MDLSPYWDYLQKVAETRLANNKTARHVSEYGEAIELMGAAGEFASRQFFGLSTELHTHFDRGCDFVWSGKKVDVKATKLTPRLMYRFLQWPTWKPVRCDIVLMTAVDMARKHALVVGYVTAEDVRTAMVNNDRPTPCHEIPTSFLRPAWLLMSRGMTPFVPQAQQATA